MQECTKPFRRDVEAEDERILAEPRMHVSGEPDVGGIRRYGDTEGQRSA
jgi:hypothetical protein